MPDDVSIAPLLPDRPELTPARRRLFEAALRLFGDTGYHAVSVRDLVTELGLKPAALYAHVPSKQHLLYELVRVGVEEHRDRLKAALLDAGRDPEDQIAALVRAHVLVHLEFPGLARVTSREMRALSPEQQEQALVTRRESEQMFLDVIERGVRLGEFHPLDSGLAVLAVGAMGIRAAEWWDPETSPPAVHIADTYAAFAVRLLS